MIIKTDVAIATNSRIPYTSFCLLRKVQGTVANISLNGLCGEGTLLGWGGVERRGAGRGQFTHTGLLSYQHTGCSLHFQADLGAGATSDPSGGRRLPPG